MHENILVSHQHFFVSKSLAAGVMTNNKRIWGQSKYYRSIWYLCTAMLGVQTILLQHIDNYCVSQMYE